MFWNSFLHTSIGVLFSIVVMQVPIVSLSLYLFSTYFIINALWLQKKKNKTKQNRNAVQRSTVVRANIMYNNIHAGKEVFCFLSVVCHAQIFKLLIVVFLGPELPM